MFKSIVAYSEDPLASEAAQDLIQSVMQNLDGHEPVAGILFTSYLMDPQPISSALRKTFPNMGLIGCSTEGNVSSNGGYMQNGAVLMVFISDRITIRTTVCRELSKDIGESVSRALGEVLQEGDQAAFFIALPESLTVGGDAVIAALRNATAADMPIFGGLSADNWSMDSTYQVFNEEVLHDAAPLLVFLDDPTLKFTYGVKSGWFPLGEHGTVTRAEGNQLREIDGKPADEFYKHYFGPEFQILGEFPLLVETPDGDFLRAPLNHHKETGAIYFAGDVPEGSRVRVTTAKRQVVVDAVDGAVGEALSAFDGIPGAALVFTCAARHYVLGPDTHLELKNTMNLLGDEIPTAGFYTFGEYAPAGAGKTVCMHNETFTVLLVGER